LGEGLREILHLYIDKVPKEDRIQPYPVILGGVIAEPQAFKGNFSRILIPTLVMLAKSDLE